MNKFQELTPEVIQQYAKAFNIAAEELKDIEKLKNLN